MEHIVKEMTQYIEDFVIKPHPVFNNMSVCPFAKKALLKNKIQFEIYDFNDGLKDSFLSIIRNFIDQNIFELLMFIGPNDIDIVKLHNFTKQLEGVFAEVEVFDGHPQDDFNVAGLYTHREPYPNIVVQKKSLLNKARNLLKKTRYFDKWNKIIP